MRSNDHDTLVPKADAGTGLLGPVASDQGQKPGRPEQRTRREIPRIRPHPPTYCRRPWRHAPPILFQGETSCTAGHWTDLQGEGRIRIKWEPGSAGPKGPLQRPEEDYRRVLVAQHREALPRRSLAEYHHWWILGQSLHCYGMGCHQDELPR
jgi:hypothetical protein